MYHEYYSSNGVRVVIVDPAELRFSHLSTQKPPILCRKDMEEEQQMAIA